MLRTSCFLISGGYSSLLICSASHGRQLSGILLVQLSHYHSQCLYSVSFALLALLATFTPETLNALSNGSTFNTDDIKIANIFPTFG